MKLDMPTEEEMRQMDAPFTPGFAKFVVKKAEEKISKKGSPMIELQLSVTDSMGINRAAFDYLVNLKSMIWKIKHFCEQTGLIKEFEKETLEDFMCEGKCGICIVEIEKSEQYNDKIKIKDYYKPDTKMEEPLDDGMVDDEIPFF